MKLSALPSLTEDKASSAPVLAETLSSVKMEEASAPLEFNDHPDMARYVFSFISFSFSNLSWIYYY